MRKVATLEAGDTIINRENFQNHSGNFRGVFSENSHICKEWGWPIPADFDYDPSWDGDVYLVYSYQKVVAVWVEGYGWAIDQSYYSTTTSRHTGVVRRAVARWL